MPYKSNAQRKAVHANKNRKNSAIHSDDVLAKKTGRIISRNGVSIRDKPIMFVTRNPVKGVDYMLVQGGHGIGVSKKSDLNHMIKLRQELRKKAGLKPAKILYR